MKVKTSYDRKEKKTGLSRGLWIFLIFCLICSIISLIRPRSVKFDQEAIDKDINVTGRLSWPDLSGECHIDLDNGQTFTGQVDKGQPAGKGEAKYPDGSKIQGVFGDTGIDDPTAVLPDGKSWSWDQEKETWKLVEE